MCRCKYEALARRLRLLGLRLGLLLLFFVLLFNGMPDDLDNNLAMLDELGGGLDRYVRSRVIYATFKIAHRPAKMAGLGGLYDFLDRGFAVMRPMGSAQDFLNQFIGKERAIVDALCAGTPDPFNP